MATLTNLQKAKGKLLIQQVFIASLVMSTPLVADPTIRTAATDMLKIYYSPTFIDGLTINQIMFVLAHEVLHIMFKHGLRRGGRNPRLWNIACDYAINYILHKSGFEVIQGCLFDPRFADMSAEQIYEILQKEKEEEQKRGGQPGGKSFDDKHKDTGLGDEDVKAPENMGPDEKAKIDQEVQRKVAQAATMARMAGKMPAGLARIIDEILNPTIPWEEVLAEYMRRIVQDDESWSRRNRRFKDVYLPARHSVRMGPIIFIADTSGSISSKEINQMGAEVMTVAETLQPESIRVVCCDSAVQNDQLFEQGDELKIEFNGGGGTDMRVALKYVEKYDPVVVVLLTDGWTPWPTTGPDYPLIVICTTTADCPVGEVIRV